MPYIDADEVRQRPSLKISIPGEPSKVISVRQNNPGNIKFAGRPGQLQEGTRGFAVYDSPESGFEGLVELIDNYYKPNYKNISSMAEAYAPRFENDTDAWIKNVSQLTGFRPNTPLGQIPTIELAKAIAKVESNAIVQPKPQAQGTFISEESLKQPSLTDQPSPKPSLTALQPPKSLESMVGEGVKENLPLAGMLGGGFLGAGAGPLGSVAGSGLGYAAGQQAQNIISGLQGKQLPPIPEQLAQAGKGFLTGATAEAGGQVIGKAIEPLVGGALARGAKSIEDVERFRMAQDLAAKGINLDPTTVIEPGKMTRGLAWIVNKFEPGKSIAQAYRRKTLEALTEMRRSFVEQTMGLPAVGSMRAGEAPETISKVFTAFKETNPNAALTFPKTQAWLKELDNIPKKSQELYELALGSTGRTLSPTELEKFNTEVWKSYSKLTNLDKTFRNDLLSNIYSDLPSDLAASLKFAKATTREIKQAELIETLLERATSPDGNLFYPLKFYDVIKKNQNNITRSLDKSQARTLYNFAEQMKLASGTEKIYREMGRKESPFWQAVSSGPGIASIVGGVTQSPYLLLPAGFQGMMAWSLSSPSGALNKLLTSGMPTMPAKAGLATKIGLTKKIEDWMKPENE